MHQFVLLMELIKKSQQTVQRMGKRKMTSSDFETVWQDRFGLQLWSLTFPSLIFLASLFWPHISPPTHIYLHFANFSLSKISKSFVTINLCVNICTHCQSWDWLWHLILQGRSWIKHRIRDLCNEKHHFQSKVKTYTNSECLEITLRYLAVTLYFPASSTVTLRIIRELSKVYWFSSLVTTWGCGYRESESGENIGFRLNEQ